ncbi:MAG: hypothetical protein BGO47_02560 [Microbacterium sp. 67-17]|nr:MAG: hypothetical protein BGO47_02560 [Microbacterium sp. 67-17]
MRSRISITIALTASAALALTGCASGGADSSESNSEQGFKVAAFTSGNQTPVGAWWVKATEAQATQSGWDMTMIQGDFDFQKMNPAVESAIGQGVDVVIDGYTDFASIGSICTAAQDAGVPIFAIDSGTEPSDCFAVNMITDQELIVDQTTGALGDALGGLDGKNIMIIGHDPHAGIRKRAALAEEVFRAAGANVVGGGIQKVTSPATGRIEALALVADYLSANPGGLDGVWVGWDDAALGAVQAIEEAGTSTRVVAVDASAEALRAIESGGAFLATAVQPWPEINARLMKAVLAYEEDGTLPTENYIEFPTVLATRENAADITPTDELP